MADPKPTGLTNPDRSEPQGKTIQVQGETGTQHGTPRAPHERDESADSAPGAPREIMRKAQRDIDAGRVDTDRGPPSEAAYEKQKEAPGRHNRRP